MLYDDIMRNGDIGVMSVLGSSYYINLNHKTFLIILCHIVSNNLYTGYSYPEGNFRGNQLLDGSIGL